MPFLIYIIQPSVLTEKQRIERFKASFYKSSNYPLPSPASPLSRQFASQEVREGELSSAAPQPCGERNPAAIRVSVIKTNKRNQSELEPETLPLFRSFLVHKIRCDLHCSFFSLRCDDSLTEEESQLLWKYAHKKFRKEKEKTFVEKKRKSVIVGPENSSQKKICQNEYVEINPCDPLSGLMFCTIDFDVDWVLEDLRGKFEDKWSKINFGEQVISEYVQFCENKKEFQPAFWHVVNLNLR